VLLDGAQNNREDTFMKQILQNFKTGVLSVEEMPVPKVQPGGVLVANVFSLISAGTERLSVERKAWSVLMNKVSTLLAYTG
jgi:hypothetical protein